jgi:hypothetical protein
MESFKVKRVKGRGLATSNGFPTINVQLELDSIDEGAWVCRINIGEGWMKFGQTAIASVSKYKGCLATEIHAYDTKNLDIKEGDEITIVFIKKLRDKKVFKDPIEQIKSDIESARSAMLKTCGGCEKFYSKDYGYSNYTIEGTTYGCFIDQFDESEDDDVSFNGVDCKYYTDGSMWMFDVDGEEPYPSDDWFKSINRDVKLIDLLNNK